MTTGSETFFHGGRGSDVILGFENCADAALISFKELGRIGKIRMIWEESVSLWAEEGEHCRGRLKLQGSNFLNADEITFLDDSMVASTMEAFEEGPLKGFSVDRFLPGQQLKVFGRRKSFSSAPVLPSAAAGTHNNIIIQVLELVLNYNLYIPLICPCHRFWRESPSPAF